MRVPGYFSSIPQDVNSAQSVDLNELARELSAQVDNWNSRGSGFVIERILKFTICITKFHPLHGSSYIPTPPQIANKTCTINVRNNDNKCFLWSVLACLYPPSNHAEQLYHYRRYQDTLNVDGLNFTLAIKDIPKFEKLNPTISINVLSLDEGDFCLEYCSPERQRPHHVNLLLLSETATDKKHYIYIKNMSRLVAGRTKHKGASHVCNGCLHPFSRKELLDRHIPECIHNPPQRVVYPNPKDEDECTLKFRAHYKQFRLPFYLMCDFESFLSPVGDDDDENLDFSRGVRPIDEHRVCGFACHLISNISKYQTDPVVYSGRDVMSKFYDPCHE